MPPLRLLIASDDAEIREQVRWVMRALRTAGEVEVVAEACDGPAAVRLAQAHAPDIVLLDCEMPRLHSLDATSLIRSRVPMARIVVLTAGDAAVGGLLQIRLGADDHIPKSRLAIGVLRLVDRHLLGEEPPTPPPDPPAPGL
jgi:DNA-binding NarL/FixJ family response regulator